MAFGVPNPLVQAARAQEQKKQQIARLLQAGTHLQPPGAAGVPPMGSAPFTAAVPTQPQVPVQPPKSLAPPLVKQPPIPGTPNDPQSLSPDMLQSQAEQYGAMARQLLAQPDAAQPTYTAPQRQEQDPRAILIAGLGSMLFGHGVPAAVAAGISDRDKELQTKYEQDVEQSENAYNRQMASYDRAQTSRENRINHLLVAQESAGKEAETMRDHLVREAAVNQGLKLKAQQISDRKSEAAQKLQEQIWATAGHLGIDKEKIAEQYFAVGQNVAARLQAQGMRDDTALNVAQLSASTRLLSTVINGQNAYARTQLQQNGMWDRVQLIQQNLNARGAMNGLNKLLVAAMNPKNPNARAAVAQLQQEMSDPNSGLYNLMQQMQGMGIMGEPVGDELRAEVEASLPLTGGAPAGGSNVTVNVGPQAQGTPGFIGEPGGGQGGGPVGMGTVQDYLHQLGIGGQGGGGGAPARVPGNNAHDQAAHAAAQPQQNPLLAHYDEIQRFYQSAIRLAGKSPEEAWEAIKHGITGANPAQIEEIHQKLLGGQAGGPNAKNSPIPSLP